MHLLACRLANLQPERKLTVMDAVRVEERGYVLEVTLDKPKANAIDGPTSRAMSEIFVEFRDNPKYRVAILTGAV